MTQNDENEAFLRVYSRKIRDRFPSEKVVVYKEFYSHIENENLKEIFAILHANLNDLLDFLNYKNNPGVGGHYNAEQSRDFMDILDILRILQAQLKNSPLNFGLDQHYEEILAHGSSFLVKFGGSPIPEDMPRVNVIEHKAVFGMLDVVEVTRPHTVSSYPARVIGRGSYATVSKYTDSYYNQTFVLKRAHRNLNEKELIRFKNEYETLLKMDSLHVIKVFNYNEARNEYTMEFADFTLEKFISLNNNKLPMTERIKLILQLFRAFSYIHDKGILHRDISYQNILVKVYDDANILKVSDFGLVKLRESTLTSDGSSIKGTLNDSALALVGFANYEVRHEIYALSQVINFILSGRTSADSIFDKSVAVREFLVKGMNPDIEQRYTSVAEMERAFNEVRAELLRLS